MLVFLHVIKKKKHKSLKTVLTSVSFLIYLIILLIFNLKNRTLLLYDSTEINIKKCGILINYCP